MARGVASPFASRTLCRFYGLHCMALPCSVNADTALGGLPELRWAHLDAGAHSMCFALSASAVIDNSSLLLPCQAHWLSSIGVQHRHTLCIHQVHTCVRAPSSRSLPKLLLQPHERPIFLRVLDNPLLKVQICMCVRSLCPCHYRSLCPCHYIVLQELQRLGLVAG